MGQDSSKLSPPNIQQIFTSDTPVSFSPDLISSLQESPENDSTRATDLELHIQRRVQSELSRLESEAAKRLSDLQESISSSPDPTTESTLPNAKTPDQSADKGGLDSKARAEGDKTRDLGRQSVQNEIDALKEKLKRRKIKEDVVKDKGVEKAKGEVVECLRLNDRRPLDCWREVETFKQEVGRLERSFLEKVWE
ncbi:MAG: hypothetical protein Q9190_003228 [Brigantiaea leucoxantha]